MVSSQSFQQLRTSIRRTAVAPYFVNGSANWRVLLTHCISNCMFLSCHVRVSEWIYTLYFPECQGTPCSKQARYLKFRITDIQRQPVRDICWKRCSDNMQQIYRRAPTPKCNFNKVAKQLYWNRTSTWRFSCKFAAYFEKIFSKGHLRFRTD